MQPDPQTLVDPLTLAAILGMALACVNAMMPTTLSDRARKLLVALWSYVRHGVVIEGAVMKTAPKA